MSFGQAWLKWQQRMVCGNIARHGVRKIESLVQFPARFEEINLLGPAGEYHRQVVSSLSGLSEHPCPSGQQRVLEYRSAQDAGSMKSAQGHLVFREAVAESLRRRDALVTDPDDILFFDDFIQAATFGLSLWSEGDSSYAVMVPFPGFPLARACANANGRVIPYFLEKGFGYMGDITMATLQRTIEIIASTARPRVLILQNPGPTGQLLSLESLQRCLEFAAEHSLVIFAQEDDSMLHDKTFVSCRHVAAAMDLDVPVMTCFAMEDLDQIGACGSFIHLQRASSFLPAELTSCMDIQPFDRNFGRQLVTRSGQETLPKSQGSFICQCYNGRVEVEWWWHKLWEKQCWDAHLCTNGCKGLSHEESYFSIQTGRWCILLWTAGENGPFNNTWMFLWPTSWNVSLQDVYAAQRLIWACSRWGPAVSQRASSRLVLAPQKTGRPFGSFRYFWSLISLIRCFGARNSFVSTVVFCRTCVFLSPIWTDDASYAAMQQCWGHDVGRAQLQWVHGGGAADGGAVDPSQQVKGICLLLVYLWYVDLQVYTDRCIHISIYTKCI